MSTIDLGEYAYFPVLCCSDAEHQGYRNLSADDKDAIIPIFELGQHKHDPDLKASIALIQSSAGERPYIIDLSHDLAPPAYEPQTGPTTKTISERQATASYNLALSKLLNPKDGFSAWQGLLEEFPNCIPVVQFTDLPSQESEILHQCKLLAEDRDIVAVRFTAKTPNIFPLIQKLFQILGDPTRLFVIIDCGQARKLGTRGEFAADSYQQILNSLPIEKRPDVRAACLSSAVPGEPKVGLKEYDTCDWEIWTAAREVAPIGFGDYSGMRRTKKNSTFVPPSSVPTIAYPLDAGWLVYRHRNSNDPDGYSEGSKQILDHASHEPLKTSGYELIVQAAKGDLSNANSSRFWFASRVNMHLHKQRQVAEWARDAYDSDEA